MTAPSEMGRKHTLNYIPNGVGRWFAAAERICGYITTIGYYHISVNYFGRSKPLPYHVIFLETKNYCGITKSYKINLTIPPSCLRQPTSLYTREAEFQQKKHPKRVLFVTYLIIFQLPFRSSPPYEERGSLSNP